MARALNSAVAEAEVSDLAHDGRGIAHAEGKTVFISDALPGERVRYRLLKRRAQFDEAALVEIIVPSPDRVEPGCAHFGVCGGCALQHLSSEAQVRIKQSQLLVALQRIGGVQPARTLAPLRGPIWGYRRRARLGVKFVRKKQRVMAGFRERSLPFITEVKRCEVLIEPLQTLPAKIAALVEQLELRESIPQVEIACGDDATALVFRIMREPSQSDRDRLSLFGRELGADIYLQTGGIDTISAMNPDAKALRYRLPGANVDIGFEPSDFIQINAALNAGMIEQALDQLNPEPQDTVLDLFCGLGNFTLPLAGRAAHVVGVEADENLLARARSNAALNRINNAEFFAQDLFESAAFGTWGRRTYDLVLMDPPRAGARAVVERMSRWKPRRVVYISCHPGSLARDAGILSREQGYDLIAAGVMDMFAHTSHVESITVFERRS